MARRRYLVAYDICEPTRLRRVIKIMESYGERLQYSVFLCDLSGAELQAWKADILDVRSLSEDSVVRLDLGATTSPIPVQVLGRSRRFPSNGPTIV